MTRLKKQRFYYLMDLHYSQTIFGSLWCQRQFYYLMDLHYSQTMLGMAS